MAQNGARTAWKTMPEHMNARKKMFSEEVFWWLGGISLGWFCEDVRVEKGGVRIVWLGDVLG